MLKAFFSLVGIAAVMAFIVFVFTAFVFFLLKSVGFSGAFLGYLVIVIVFLLLVCVYLDARESNKRKRSKKNA